MAQPSASRAQDGGMDIIKVYPLCTPAQKDALEAVSKTERWALGIDLSFRATHVCKDQDLFEEEDLDPGTQGTILFPVRYHACNADGSHSDISAMLRLSNVQYDPSAVENTIFLHALRNEYPGWEALSSFRGVEGFYLHYGNSIYIPCTSSRQPSGMRHIHLLVKPLLRHIGEQGARPGVSLAEQDQRILDWLSEQP